MNKKLLLYLTAAGRSPFEEWLNALQDDAGVAKIRIRLDRARMGNLGDHRTVGQGVVELRVAFGPGYRIYIGQSGSDKIVLLCGGDKDSQRKDIHKAHHFWREYRRIQ